jgi:hypothetical protein
MSAANPDSVNEVQPDNSNSHFAPERDCVVSTRSSRPASLRLFGLSQRCGWCFAHSRAPQNENCRSGSSLSRWVILLLLPLLVIAPKTTHAEGWIVSPTEGLRWSSSDDRFKFHAGGVFAADVMVHETGEHPDSGVYPALAKPILEGSYNDVWRFRIAGDLVGTRTANNLYEAFVSWEGISWLRLSAGLLPLPLGLEAGDYPEDLGLFAHSFSYYLDYGTDWAVRAEGQHGEGIVEWDAAYGFGEGFDANGRTPRGAQVSARAFVRPLRALVKPEASLWKRIAGGFFIGAGYVHSWDWDGELIVRSPVGTRLFDTASFEADYSRFLTITAGFEVGPVRIYVEDTTGGYYGADTPVRANHDLDNQTTSWQATVSWMITGEHYDGRIFGQHGVSPPGPNAWEVAVRYANADIDRDFYDFGLTDYSRSSQEFRSLTATLNWYATPNLRLSLGFLHIIADDDIAALDDGGRDTAGVFRVQYRF